MVAPGAKRGGRQRWVKGLREPCSLEGVQDLARKVEYGVSRAGR